MIPAANQRKTFILVVALLVSMLLGQQAVASPGTAELHMQAGQETGPASFVVDVDTGVVLHEVNADLQLPPASTSKLLTALTVRQHMDVNEPVTVVESDMVPEEFSVMGLLPGDVATVEQLLYGTLIPSGGDAARALARVTGMTLDPQTDDPVERFVQEMNRVADSLGMTDSSFGNPVGRDDERSWTTARDLVRTSEAVLDDPLLARIVGTAWASVVVSGPNERELIIENSNQFVLFDDAIGIKTGTTDMAGQNLVSAFRFGDHTVVTVVLGSGDRYADTSAMLDAVRQEWVWLDLGRDAASMGATQELESMGLWMPVGRTILVHPDQLPDMRYRIEMNEDTTGSAAGRAIFVWGDHVLAELPVYPSGEPAVE